MTIPKFLTASLFVLMVPFVAPAQNCKFDVDKKDPFTGEYTRAIKTKIGGAFWNWRMTLSQVGDKYFIQLQLVLSGAIEESIAPGNVILIKLENGKLIELEPQETFAVSHAVGNGTVASSWLPKYEVDLKTMKRLAHSPITDFKFTIGGKDFLPPIKGGQANNIMDAASCLLPAEKAAPATTN